MGAEDGIRVNTIIPFARTPAVEASLEHYAGLEERLIGSVPLRPLRDPEGDIGPAVAYLVGRGAAYITGTTLSVHGGAVRLR